MTRTSQFNTIKFLVLVLLLLINTLPSFPVGLDAGEIETTERISSLPYFHQAGSMAVNYTVTDESCPGASDGSIDLSISNATNLQSIIWSTGATTEDLIGVSAGTYQVDITDDTETLTLNITVGSASPAPVVTINGSTVVCQNTGSVPFTISASGGIPPYVAHFSKNGGSTLFTPGFSDVTTLFQSSSNTGTFVYELIEIVDGNNCVHPANGSITIQVISQATVDNPGNIEYCSDQLTPAIALSGEPENVVFDITGGAAIGLSDQFGVTEIPSFLASTGAANVTITPVANGCSGIPVTINATVNPPFDLVVSADSETICSGASPSISFSSSSSSADFSWVVKSISPEGSIDGAGTGNGSALNQTLTNKTTSQATVVYTVSSGSSTCLGSSTDVTITVQAPIQASISSDASTCQGAADPTVTFTGLNGTPPYKFTYRINGGALQTVTSTGASTFVTQASGTAGTFVYELVEIEDAKACSNPVSGTSTIEIKEQPTADSPGELTFCQGQYTGPVSLTGTPSNLVFDITGGASIGLSNRTGVTAIPSFTALAGSANLTITPRANGCTGTPISVPVTVHPKADISVSRVLQTICSGSTSSISLSSNSTDAGFSWVVKSISPSGSISGATAGNGSVLAQTLVNTTSAQASVVYTVSSLIDGCVGSTLDVTVRVQPEVQAEISGQTTICQGDADPVIEFVATNGTAPYTFSYRINSGTTKTVSSSTSTAQVTPGSETAGTYTYELLAVQDQTGCNYAVNKTATVTVNSKPELTSDLTPAGICSNDLFSYSPEFSIPGTTYSWTRKAVPGISDPERTETSPINEYINNTTQDPIAVTYTFTMTTPDGCSNTEDVVVKVTPVPRLTSTLTPDAICSGTLFSYEPQSDVSETEFPWTRAAVTGISNPTASGTGNPNEILVNTTSSPIGVTYEYTLSSNDCSNPEIYRVQVVVMPAPKVTASASDTEICPGESVNLFSSSNLNITSLPATLLSENFNGSTGNWTEAQEDDRAKWEIQNNDYYYFSYWPYTDVTFSSNDNSDFFLINARPLGNSPWLAVNSSTLTSPAINTVGYTSLNLDFWHYYADGSNHAEIRVSTDGSSWTTVETIVNKAGKADKFSEKTVSLNAWVGQPTLYVQFYFQYQLDAGQYYWAIDNVSVTGEGSDVTMYWTSNPEGFSSTDQNPTNVSPSQTTDYIAWYVDPDTGCLGSDTVTVVVLDPPAPTITADYCNYQPYVHLCVPDGYLSYQWVISNHDGSSEIVGTGSCIDVDIAATYTVTVVDDSGCSGSASFNTATELVVNGDFELGEAGISTFYTDYGFRQPTGSLGGGLYGIGKDSRPYYTAFRGAHDHTSGNGYYMIVDGTESSKVVWQQTISVEPNTDYYFSAWAMNIYLISATGYNPHLQFSINGQLIGTDVLLNEWTNSDDNPWLTKFRFWGEWNSGTATTAVVQIRDLETSYQQNDFGLDDISFGTLAPHPAEVSPTVSADICEGESIYLKANVQYGREPITFLWTGPNGWSSTAENPVINNATTAAGGTYTVQVQDSYGCGNQSGSVSVNVYQKVNVNAGPNQQVCPENPMVTLAGTISGGATSGTWSGGLGTFSPDNRTLNATYTPSQAEIDAGTVELTLTSDTPAGPCPAQNSSTTITIYPEINLNFSPVQPICHGGADGSITVSASNGLAPYTYLWSDGQKTSKAVGLATGTYSVTVTDKHGCSVTENVFLPEPGEFVVNKPTYIEPTCYGEDNGSASISATGGTPPYEFIWDSAAGSQTTDTATNLSAGTYSVIVLSDSHGCAASAVSVTIPEPEAPDLSCPNNITVMVDPGETYASNVVVAAPDYDNFCESIEYDMTGATSGSDQGLVPSPSTFNLGVTTIRYTTVNLKGEDLHCSFTVTVKPETPEITCSDPISVSTDTAVCTAAVAISLPTIDNGVGISWTWTMSGATTDSGTGSITSPYTFNKGVTTITWVATNSAGTDTCSQTVTVSDQESPQFIEPFDVNVCVERIKEFSYTNQAVPDYYTFEPGNVMLDLNTANFTDNCGLSCGAQIEWRVVFSDGSTLPESGYFAGQPSSYASGFRFPGDGDTYQPLVHKVYYRITDCSGNQSDELVTNVTVNPRPEIVRNF